MLQKTVSHPSLARSVCLAVHTLCKFDDDFKERLGLLGACEGVARVICKYADNEGVAHAACKAIATLTSANHKSNQTRLGNAGAGATTD